MKKNLSLLLILIVVTILAGIGWYVTREEGVVQNNPLADFAIEDTAAVTKIFITDTQNNSISLEREPGDTHFRLNGKYLARKDAADLLLKTFKRIKVKSTVPKVSANQVIKNMASIGKKVEIYQGGDKPSKIYIVGTATQDHFGTYMLLETPEEGRSTEPFIMHMEGFTGFLSTRFFTDELDWRYTGVFDYPNLEISKVAVTHHDNPDQSFEILYNGGNDIELYSNFMHRNVPNFDTLAVKNYMLLYKKAHLETYLNYLTEAGADSLRKTTPAFTFQVWDKDQNMKKMDLYWKNPTKDILADDGTLEKWDMSRMYGRVDNDELVLVQRYVFDHFMVPIASFATK